MTEIEIPFNNSEKLTAKIPNTIEITEYMPNSLVSNPGRIDNLLELALMHPIDSPKLSELIKDYSAHNSKKLYELKILIIVDDHTRITPVKAILPALLIYLHDCGVKADQVKVLTAGGSHRLMAEDELKSKFGQKIIENLEIEQHDWTDPSNLVNMGKTDKGIPIIVNRHIKNADITIGIGNIVPHEIVGFSGGSKIILPGISTNETVEKVHWMSTEITIEKRLGNNINPIRNQINQAGKIAGLDFIINTVMDREKKTIGIFSGDPISAQNEGSKFSKEIFSVKNDRTDVIITDTLPETTDFWTSAKAVLHTSGFVNHGGIMIVCAECPEGMCRTHPQIMELGYHSPLELEEKLSIKNKDGSPKYNRLTATHCANLWEILQHCSIYLVTRGISKEDAEFLGFHHYSNLQDAIDDALHVFPDIKKINIIRDGSEIMAKSS